MMIHPWQIVLVSIAGWINRHQPQIIEFQNLQLEECQKALDGKRIPFTDRQRRTLAEKAKALGRETLEQITTLVTPDTLLRWHKRLVAEKWTHEHKSPVLPDHGSGHQFTARFRKVLSDAGVEPKVLPPASPDLNAYAERFVRSIKEQCLDKMIFFGEQMLRHAIKQYLAWYHGERNIKGSTTS